MVSKIFFRMILIVLAGYFIGGGCGHGKKSELSGTEIKIIIFHINDIHGQIKNFAKIYSLIEQERKKSSNVFFMCAGDNFSGNPFVDQYIPKGEPVLELLNYLGCNVQVLGNHEFDYGQEILSRYMLKSNFGVICANVNTEKSKIPQPEPYMVLKTKEGIKIAVLGVLQISKETGQPDCHPDKLFGLLFSDELKTARKYAYLKKQNEVFIALTHMGFYKDEKLAMQMGELDIIIGGHSHTVIEEPRETNGVLISQTGSKNRYLGKIELVLKNKKIIKKKGELIDLGLIKEEDKFVNQMIKKYESNPHLSQVICTLPAPLRSKSDLGNLVTDAICQVLHLDVAFYNSGGIRINRLAGEVKLKDIYALHPFGNEIIIYNLTPAEIRSLIRFDYKHIGPLDIQVSGIKYTVIANKERSPLSVELFDYQGNRLNESKTYSVGMNNYMASVYEFKHQDPGHSSHMKMVDVMITYLKRDINTSKIRGIKRVNEKIVD